MCIFFVNTYFHHILLLKLGVFFPNIKNLPYLRQCSNDYEENRRLWSPKKVSSNVHTYNFLSIFVQAMSYSIAFAL